MKIFLLFIFMFVIAAYLYPAEKSKSNSNFIKLPALFSDNMVLQQKAKVDFWGKANPGEEVVITAGWGVTARAEVKDDSTWIVKVMTKKAGGPYEVKIKIGDSTIVYKNVMLGEVWLCSGQSNMEMPLEGWPDNIIKNSAEEIKEADYPDIRLYTVARALSAEPEFNCAGTWSECNPQTAAKFSAAAYFFGRKLYKELKVPIGLIHSSWGGTKIQSWTSGKYLRTFDDYDKTVDKIEASKGEIKKQKEWIYSHPVVDVSKKPADVQFKDLDFGDSSCSKTEFDDSRWHTMNLPAYWEITEVGGFDGAVWFRKKIEIPKSWMNTDLVLDLGPIDDMDRAYVNGAFVGEIEEAGFYQTPRVYKVPKDLVKDSILTIAVRVLDTGGGGGLWGNGVRMQIHPENPADSSQSISLEGEWKYLPVAEYLNNKFYVYKVEGQEFFERPKTEVSVDPNTPTMLYNGMIAPLIPYTIKGVIWYQGESNSDEPNDYNNYSKLFPLMIKNWRADWKEGNFPFYYVQIAPWSYGDKSKSYMIRWAQCQTLSVPNTGMAVTLDIGDLKTIHPADKQDVGLRLALWALAKNYHKKVFYSGPVYKFMKIEKGKIILSFEYAGKGLVMKDENGNTNFLIAGKDQKFIKANVKVEGKKLIVYSDEVKEPAAVRYTWSNTAEATLFNEEGLPGSTFKTDDWKE